jgi:hypothetical protein
MKTFQAVLPLLVLIAACTTNGDPRVSVMLTDAPGDFKAAVVTIAEIHLVGPDGKVVLSDAVTTTNLLTLANDAATLVDGVEVPAGTYSELRFVITGGYVEVEQADGSSIIYASSPTYAGLPAGASVGGTLTMPSLAQSGLKVDMAAGALVLADDSEVLLIDFDVAQSFGHDAGNSGAWVMHPVIKGADFTLTGTVNATAKLGPGVTLPVVNTVQISLGDFGATLVSSSGSVKTLTLGPTSVGSTTFGASFKYLLPGDYSLALGEPAGTDLTVSPVLPAAVTVGSGQSVDVDFTVTGASVR